MSEADRVPPWAQALGRVASGLYILTARQGSQETGMLASWVQQCSFDPPLVSAAIRRGRALESWLTPGSTFVLNILDDTQTDMIIFFGKGVPPGENVFAELEVERTQDGTAILTDTLAYLECHVEKGIEAGDHELLLGRVVGGKVLSEGKPMLHVRKSGLHY